MNNKRYFFDKMIFPRVLITDEPGIIINKTVSKFGRESSRTRVIFSFEDIANELYQNTSKIIGKTQTDKLWYEIGKNIGARYTLFFENYKISKKKAPKIIEHIFKVLSSAGMNFAKKTKYIPSRKHFTAIGENCLFCRRNQNQNFMEGTVSGILTTILNENFGAKSECKECPKYCRIISSPKIIDNCKIDIKELTKSKYYKKLNFPKIQGKHNSLIFPSFRDLIKFNKIQINEKEGFFYFQNKVIFPSEIGLNELVIEVYRKNNHFDLAKKIIILSSKNIAKDIFNRKNSTQKNMNLLRIILSAFGWGIIDYKESESKITLNFKNPPITRYGNHLRGFILNGFLNHIFKKELEINKINDYTLEFIPKNINK